VTVYGARLRRRPARRKLGLALGAGGARGLAHIGVLRALSEAGVSIGAIAGTSSGALVGAIYAAGQLEIFERRMRELRWNEVLTLFDPAWPRAGLISAVRVLERFAPGLGDWRIEDLPIPFAAISVDLVTGEEIAIREGRLFDAIRASISIPGIFVPHIASGRLLVDGALRNPVPVSTLGALGADVRVAVNLHQRPVRELSLRRRSTRRAALRARLNEMFEEGVARLRRRPREVLEAESGETPEGETLPNLFEILTASMSVLEYELAQHRLARERVDVIIEPELDGSRAYDFHTAARAIQSGRRAAEDSIASIERALRRPRMLRARRTTHRPS
jgi:NTE family protein